MKGSGCPSFGQPQNNYICGSCLGKRPGGQSKKGTAGDAAPADVSSKRAKTEHGDGTASAAEDRLQAELLEQLEKLQEKKKMLLLQVGDVKKEEKALLIEIASDVAGGSMSAGESECADMDAMLQDTVEDGEVVDVAVERPKISCRDDASGVMQKRSDSVDYLFEFMSAREKMRENMELGAKGDAVYDGVEPEFAASYKTKQVHNVDRAADPPTQAFLAIAKNASKTYGAVDKIHPLLVLNYTVWRTVGGTVGFALLLGFLHTWSFIEKNLVASTLEFIWRKGGAVVEVMLSNAYSAPRVLRYGLLNATPARREFLLRTPDWVKEKKPKFWQSLTWPGRASSIDSAWDNADRVAQTRMELSKQRTCEALAQIQYFGTTRGKCREPGFFAKEVVEDLMLTPFFGRAPSDEDTYQIAGVGAICGLEFLLGVQQLSAVEAQILMVALYEHLCPLWSKRHRRALKLHDVQFQLCQYGRKCKGTMVERRVCSNVAKSINEWIARAVRALGEGETVELVSARFREQFASLPDVRE